MSVEQIITAMFLNSEIYFEHHKMHEGGERYCVITADENIIFLCTEEWWNHVRQTHPTLAITVADCGCVIEQIIPNTQLHLVPSALNISSN